jgi:DNA-binding beta-propeller fold protein YncE
VAVDSHGHVFVADTGNSRIVELSPAGTQLTQWTGDAYGLYVHPTAIAVDAHGEILVVDTRYNCITLVQSTSHDIWCGYDVQGLISFVVAGVAVDPHGNVYASDANTGRVVRLRSSLGPHLLHEWRVASPSGGRPVHLAGLAPDRQGNLYVVDGSNNQVSKLSSTGRRLGSWKFFGSPAGLLAGPSGLTVDRQGAVYVAVSGNDSVQKIVPANGSVAVWTRLDPPAARVDEPHAVSIDSKGDVFVITGSARNHILKFSSHGTLLSDWGPSALRQAGMYVLTGLATDLRGNVYASDAFNDRIYKLSGSGGLLAVWKVKVSTQSAPYGIALDGSGNIYVADMGDQALKKLSPQGRYLGQAILPALPNWAINETCSNCAPTDQQVITPREVAVGRNGVAYLLDSDHHIVVKLSSSRKVLRLWGSKESTSAALKDPVRLALDKRGNVFVLDAAQNKVFEFSPQGDLLARWGAKGSKPGHLLSPDGIAVDRSGNVYVADTGNNRLQKLTRTR